MHHEHGPSATHHFHLRALVHSAPFRGCLVRSCRGEPPCPSGVRGSPRRRSCPSAGPSRQPLLLAFLSWHSSRAIVRDPGSPHRPSAPRVRWLRNSRTTMMKPFIGCTPRLDLTVPSSRRCARPRGPILREVELPRGWRVAVAERSDTAGRASEAEEACARGIRRSHPSPLISEMLCRLRGVRSYLISPPRFQQRTVRRSRAFPVFIARRDEYSRQGASQECEQQAEDRLTRPPEAVAVPLCRERPPRRSRRHTPGAG